MRFRRRRYKVIKPSAWDPGVHRCRLPLFRLGLAEGAIIECPCGQQWRLEAEDLPGRPVRWFKYRPEETG